MGLDGVHSSKARLVWVVRPHRLEAIFQRSFDHRFAMSRAATVGVPALEVLKQRPTTFRCRRAMVSIVGVWALQKSLRRHGTGIPFQVLGGAPVSRPPEAPS